MTATMNSPAPTAASTPLPSAYPDISGLPLMPQRFWGRWLCAALIALLLFWLVRAFAHGQIEWRTVGEFLTAQIILQGLIATIVMAVAAMALGIVLGIITAVMHLSPNPLIKAVAVGYAWFFRGTPVLVQLMLVYFGLPYLLGFDLFPFELGRAPFSIEGALAAGIVTFGLHEAAMMSEIARAGIGAVDHGQIEAARALGMGPGLTVRRIVLPQAVPLMIPPLGNQFNTMLKTTSLLSVIGVGELFRAAEEMQAASFKTFEVYLGISLYYLLLTALWSVIQQRMERRLQRGSWQPAAAASKVSP